MISDDDIARDRALFEAATPGPWVRVDRGGQFWAVVGDGWVVAECHARAEYSGPDATFIARARTALPEYIAEVERLRAAIKARAVCARCKGAGTVERSCSLCGDSTYDHWCNDSTVACPECSGVGVQKWATDVLNGGEIK